MTLTKLDGLSKLIQKPVYIVQYIVCLLAEEVKNTILMSQKLHMSAWNGAGDLPLDYTSVSLVTHGEPRKYKNEQHRKVMQAPINEDRIRKAGW
jgi:hypothetical protein